MNNKDFNDLVVECSCGKRWWMDYEPAPDNCNSHPSRLGTVSWTNWVDENGNEVKYER